LSREIVRCDDFAASIPADTRRYNSGDTHMRRDFLNSELDVFRHTVARFLKDEVESLLGKWESQGRFARPIEVETVMIWDEFAHIQSLSTPGSLFI
jgi:hypothetical protein